MPEAAASRRARSGRPAGPASLRTVAIQSNAYREAAAWLNVSRCLAGFRRLVRRATDGQWTQGLRIVNLAMANSNKIGILRECRRCDEAVLVPVVLGGRT